MITELTLVISLAPATKIDVGACSDELGSLLVDAEED